MPQFFQADRCHITPEQRLQFDRLPQQWECIATTTGQFVYLNSVWESQLGWSISELMTRPWWEWICPSDRPSTQQAISEWLAAQSTQPTCAEAQLRLEHRLHHKQGHTCWLRWHLMLAPDGLLYATGQTITAIQPVQDLEAKIAYYQNSAAQIQAAKIQLEWQFEERTRDLTVAIAQLKNEINERQQAQAALALNEQRMKDIAANVPGAIFQFCYRNGKWHIDYISDGIYEVMGIAPNDIIRDMMAFVRRLHPEDMKQYAASVSEAIENFIPWHYEGRLIKPSGQIRWWQGDATPTKTENGIMFCGVILDITSRKETEAALIQAKAALETKVAERTQELIQLVQKLKQENHERQQAQDLLHDREQFLRSIYDGAEQEIWAVDVLTNQQICYAGWNEYTERIVGFKSAEGVGKTPEEIFGPTDGAAVRQKYLQCLKSQQTVQYQECLFFQGQPVWWLTTLTPQFDSRGTIYRLIGTAMDISDRVRAEQALQQSEQELRQQTIELEEALRQLRSTQSQLIHSEKMSSLGQLVAGVAHEINNPVNFIHGNLVHAGQYTQDLLDLLQLYREHTPHPSEIIQIKEDAIDLEFLLDDLPKLLGSMEIGAERIREIVRSLRTFSRHDEAEVKAVHLHDGIDSTLMILQNRLKPKPDQPEIQIVKQYGDLPKVECHAGQLNQVFMNILANAIDALEDALQEKLPSTSTASSFIPAIQITTEVIETFVAIRIADNGCGMPAAVQKRLFDPFFTTKPIGKGTGLGLSISYQIITEKHKGALHCHSTIGQGTEFVIQIPIRQPAAEQLIQE
jgi:PAS domain S-box-containing protein